MRFLRLLVVVMGALIVAATVTLAVLIVRRIEGPTAVPVSHVAVVLNEPVGTHIASIAAVGDRLAVYLQGGGPDRVMLLDPRTGAVAGQIGLRGGGP